MTDIWKRRLDAARFITQYGDDEIRQHVKDNTDEDWMIRRVAENDMPDSGKLNHGAPGETGTLISRLEALEKAEEIMRTAEEERRSILDHPLPFTWYTKEPPCVDGLLVCADEGNYKRTLRWYEERDSWCFEGPTVSFKIDFHIWQSWKRWMIIEE